MMDPEKYATATVVSRRDPAPDLWIIRIHPQIELPYRPGQYVTLGLQSNGRVIERPYSICSSPAEEEIELLAPVAVACPPWLTPIAASTSRDVLLRVQRVQFPEMRGAISVARFG